MGLPNEINSILALDIPAGDRIGFILSMGDNWWVAITLDYIQNDWI